MTKVIITKKKKKMGASLINVAASREDIEIVGGIDIVEPVNAKFEYAKTFSELKCNADVIVDFSNPAVLDSMLEYAVEKNIPVVICTTGYSEEQKKKIFAASEKIAVFYSGNMSLGINLLVQLAKKAASILGDRFDIEIVEKHHNQKIDAPSGTAIMLADAINETLDNSKHYVYDRHSRRQQREKSEIGMHAIRGGTIVGEHDVIFAGHDEVITLSHSAASKSVFAEGAVNAAVFLKDQPAGLYDMSLLV